MTMMTFPGSDPLGNLVVQILPKLLGLSVYGIEVTQAIQCFASDQHLTDPQDRGADNSCRLVAGKPAWIRVYVRSLAGAGPISATLEVQRRFMGFKWPTVTTLQPDPSCLKTVPPSSTTSYADTRSNLNHTVNFVMPASEMIGTLRLIARVEAGVHAAEASCQVDVTLRQTLRLAGVMIAYDGPASMAQNAPKLTIAAPALADLQATTGTALTLFPVESTAVFRAAGAFTLTHHLQDATFPTSGCGSGWDQLLGQVAGARTADGNQPGWIYYGLLPTGVPTGPVGGCGGGGVAAGPVGAAKALAEECGHACGLGHTPAGGAPHPDPGYPAYEPYDPPNTPRGSIGEYGLDINNGAIKTPALFKDFMGYAPPFWISPYHHGKLVEESLLNPTWVGIDYLYWKDWIREAYRHWHLPDPPELDPEHLEMPVFPPTRPQDVISLIIRVQRGRVADVAHVARTRAHTFLAGASATPFTACLRDAEGAILAEAPVLRLQPEACGCPGGTEDQEGGTYLAQAFLPDVAAGASLEISDGESAVWRRAASAQPPRVELRETEVDRSGNVTVSWHGSEGTLEYWLRWSRDGETWQAIATSLTGQTVRLAAGLIPPGDGLLQVVAHDGFFSTYSEPRPITIPERAAAIAVLHPVDGNTYIAGGTVRLWASVTGTTDPAAPEAVWLADGTEIARGLDTWVRLEPGQRTLTVRVGGPGGPEASVSVTVERLEGQ